MSIIAPETNHHPYGPGRFAWPMLNESGLFALTSSAEIDRDAIASIVSKSQFGGYALRVMPNASNESVFETPIAIELVTAIKKTWQLSDPELGPLLGFSNPGTPATFDLHSLANPSSDQKERLKVLFRIHSRLSALFRDESVELRWLQNANPALNGESPFSLMQRGLMQNLFVVDHLVSQLTGA